MKRAFSLIVIVVVTGLAFVAACTRAAQPEVSTPTPLPTLPATHTPKPKPTLRPTATMQPASPTPLPPTDTAVPATVTPLVATVENPPPAPTLPGTSAPVSERLQAANRLMQNGDYAAASAVFQSILIAPLAPEEAAEARYGLGVAALRAGEYATAVTAFAEFLDQAPQDQRVADAWFLIGDARQGAGDPASAIAAYRNYLAVAGDDGAAPYAQERIGDAFMSLEDRGQAVAAYEAALGGASADLALRLHEKAGNAYAALGNAAQAVAHYDLNQEIATTAAYKAKMMFLAGQAFVDAGQSQAGYERFLMLVDTYPATADAYQALIALVDAGVPVDDYQRGVVDVHARAYVPAVEVLDRYIASGDEAHRADAFYYVGRAHAGLGHAAEAVAALDVVLSSFPNAERWGDAWIERARIQAAAQDIAGAVATYRAFADQAPDHAQAPEALWQAGLLADTNGDAGSAGAHFRELANRYPNHEHAPEGLWRAAFTAYRQGDTGTASDFWRTLAALPGGGERPAAAEFWLGQLAERQGDHEAASQHYVRAQQLAPGSYYGIRAVEVADGFNRAFSRPVNFNGDYDEAAERAEAERWLAAKLGLANTSGLGNLSAQLASDSRLRRGEAMWRLGLYGEAKIELESLRRAYAQDALASYQLALRFRDLGLYRSSIIAAAAAVRGAGASALSAPRFLGRLMYPIYYQDLVVPEAQKYGLDPLVMFALVRQESLFESFVTSYAAAHGLMQVIPPTGAWIAEQLQWPDYETQDLYRPHVSVAFGTYYLVAQRNTFEGDLYAALAAYNAGPGRSATWRRQAGGDPNLFVEFITIDQPQDYIKRITEHYAVYRLLYGQ
jgi:soluble lytic murein transglycosylase